VAGTEIYRLPRFAQPRHYKLELEPHLAEATFDGHAAITLEVTEPTRQLTFNAADLSIEDARLERNGVHVASGPITLDDEEQRATVTFAEEIVPGDDYRLHLRFHGELNDQLRGFYRSTFRDDDGAEHVIATTQFEPSDARRAFPCWDEPDFKATFVISLIVDEGLTALSNSEVVSIESWGGGRGRVLFSETIAMSTYLVAFVVGPYQLSEPKDVDGVQLRIATVPGRSHLVGYSEEVATHALRFLSNYFDIPYPGDKIDHVAVPDFAFGAMENLGCVTYRENALLADPSLASHVELQRIATVVAHETAHMWFGDLVTMKWWNGVWLNEAFATFMELTTTDAFRPDWQVWTVFGAGKSAALLTDGLRSTRPVEFEVGRPEEAEAMFDVLTYQKGGAVLRMLEQYVGPDTFRRGISRYLADHAYGNTETTDLWDSIEAASAEPVRAIMDSWIRQGGYPLIFADTTADPAEVALSQQRFLYQRTDGDGSASEDSRLWAVPVNLRASVGGALQHRRLLLEGVNTTYRFDGPADWVVVNDGAWGFYRVRYSPALWQRLQATGVVRLLDPLERLALETNMWAEVVADTAELDEWAEIVQAVCEDEDPDLWASIGAVLAVLDGLGDENDRRALRAFTQRIAGPAWERLGWVPRPDESRRTATARARVLASIGLTGRDEGVAGEASERFYRFQEDPGVLAPDLVAVASRIAVSNGGHRAWSTALDRYRAATVPQEKLRYLYALADTPDPELLTRTLDLSVSADVRVQDAPFLISAAMIQPDRAGQVWSWVESHWPQIKATFPTGLQARIFEGITTIVDPELAARIKQFCETNEMPLTGQRMDQLIERMDINVALSARLRSTLSSRLKR
jgi:puromycin-sensitive aminopeptidase